MKSILLFDSWLGGRFNFRRYFELFDSFALDIRYVVTSDWDIIESKKNCLVDESEADLAVWGKHSVKIIELGGFSPKSILAYFETLSLDLVAFLSLEAPAHRGVNAYFKRKGVTTVLMYHGLRGIQRGHKQFLPTISSISFTLSRFPRFILYSAPFHRILTEKRNRLSSFYLLYETVFAKQNYCDQEFQTTRVCVFNQRDRDFHRAKFGENSKVSVIGIPDLYTYRCQLELSNGGKTEANYLLYIDTGFYANGLHYESVNDFIDHINTIWQHAKKSGLDLHVRLKPSRFESVIMDSLERDIIIVSRSTLGHSIEQAIGVICEPTSLIALCMAFEKLLILPIVGPLANIQFGEMVVDYPKVLTVKDYINFESLQPRIQESSSLLCNNEGLKTFLSDNIDVPTSLRLKENINMFLNDSLYI